jgi:hypothetical protein
MAKNETDKKLIDEYPILVLPSLAVAVGLNEAIILQQIHYWLRTSPHERDGKLWVYNSITEWNEQFPWWSPATIKRALNKLRQTGIVETAEYNKDPRDKTLWYTINYEELGKLGSIERVSHAFGQNDQMDKVKMTQPLPETTQRLKEDPPSIERSTTPTDGKEIHELVDVVAEVCHINSRAKTNRVRIQTVVSDLREVGATPEQVREHFGQGSWWYTDFWIGKEKGSPPTMGQLVEYWGRWNGKDPQQSEAPNWPRCPICHSEALGYMGQVIDCPRCGQVDLRENA